MLAYRVRGIIGNVADGYAPFAAGFKVYKVVARGENPDVFQLFRTVQKPPVYDYFVYDQRVRVGDEREKHFPFHFLEKLHRAHFPELGKVDIAVSKSACINQNFHHI